MSWGDQAGSCCQGPLVEKCFAQHKVKEFDRIQNEWGRKCNFGLPCGFKVAPTSPQVCEWLQGPAGQFSVCSSSSSLGLDGQTEVSTSALPGFLSFLPFLAFMAVDVGMNCHNLHLPKQPNGAEQPSWLPIPRTALHLPGASTPHPLQQSQAEKIRLGLSSLFGDNCSSSLFFVFKSC